jgi:hypothetical protein
MIIFLNDYKNARKRKRYDNLKDSIKELRSKDYPMFVNVLQLDQVKKVRSKAKAVTSLMNRLRGETFETTKEIERYLDYVFRNHTEVELKETLSKAIDLLMSLHIKGKKEPNDYFPLLKLVIILPKGNDEMHKEIMSYIKDEKYSQYFMYKEVYFMFNNNKIIHMENLS